MGHRGEALLTIPHMADPFPQGSALLGWLGIGLPDRKPTGTRHPRTGHPQGLDSTGCFLELNCNVPEGWEPSLTDISASQSPRSFARMSSGRPGGPGRCWSRGLRLAPPAVTVTASDCLFLVLLTALRAQNHPDEV